MAVTWARLSRRWKLGIASIAVAAVLTWVLWEFWLVSPRFHATLFPNCTTTELVTTPTFLVKEDQCSIARDFAKLRRPCGWWGSELEANPTSAAGV